MIIYDIADSGSSCERPGGEFSNESVVELKKLSAGFGLKVLIWEAFCGRWMSIDDERKSFKVKKVTVDWKLRLISIFLE